MARTSKELGPRDDNTIDIDKSGDRRRWANKLGVSVAELQSAVDAVGTNPQQVERYLRGRAQPSRTA